MLKLGTMLKLFVVVLAAAALALLVTPVANAQERTTFVAQLSAENEVPLCTASLESNATGVAIIQIDAATGEISYRVLAANLPGTIAGGPGAHIHVGPAGVAGGVLQPLQLTGNDTGVVAEGTAINLALATAILADPANYYVNVHTVPMETGCPPGAIRGQLG